MECGWDMVRLWYLVLASPQQLRFAMEEELLASRLLADDLREDSMHLKKLFLDVRQDSSPRSREGGHASAYQPAYRDGSCTTRFDSRSAATGWLPSDKESDPTTRAVCHVAVV